MQGFLNALWGLPASLQGSLGKDQVKPQAGADFMGTKHHSVCIEVYEKMTCSFPLVF